MELRYRRKMKMPVWSLPGFVEGGQVYGGASTMYDDVLGTKRYGFAQSIPQLSQPTAPNINIGDINAQMNQQKQIDWSSNSIPLSQQNNGNIFGPNNQEVWDKSADFTKNTTLINGVQQKVFSSTHGNGGGGLNARNAGQIAMGAINLGFATADSFGKVKKDNELYANAGQSTGYGAGYNFVKQNRIDEAGEMSDLNAENQANTLKTTAAGVGLGAGIGAAIGGVAGPIGAAAGAILGLGIGLWGGANRKRKLRKAIYNAQQDITRRNTFSNASAQTDYLTQNYYNKYGNPYDDQIYNAKYGKDADGWKLPDNSVKGKVREFNRKLSLPNIKEND